MYMRLFALMIMMVGVSLGQQPFNQLLLTTPPPPNVPAQSISAATVGVAGNSTYYYFVVANYPIGSSSISGPAQVTRVNPTLSVSNYVTVGWQSMPSATSYDVLRSTTPAVPATPCTCKVGNTSTTSINDQSNTLTSYTLTTAAAANGALSIDNLTQSVAFLNWLLNGTNYQVGIWDTAAVVGDCAIKGTTPGKISTQACATSGSSSPNIATITRPTPGEFAWVNQGSTVLSTTGGGLNITGPPAANTQIRAQVDTLNGATFNCTMNLAVLQISGNARSGAVFRESATGKMLTFGAGGGNPNTVIIDQWSDANTYVGTRATISVSSPMWSNGFWIKFKLTATDVEFYASPDGVNFSLYYTELKTQAFTVAPNQCGIFFDSEGVGSQPFLSTTLLSYDNL